MKRGLIIGKFMPIHNGHLALINFALSQCDELIISMTSTKDDIIDPSLRFSWLWEIFNNNTRIKPAMVEDDFDDDSLPMLQRTKIAAIFIKKTFPKIHIIFSSEEYGESLAHLLGAANVLFDIARKQFPVSGSLIRSRPFQYWDSIPAVVRPYFVKKICFYGPESTGKSLLAEKMARKYDTEFVPEVAREFISSSDFTEEDIIKIGNAHFKRILEKLKIANKILICDTDALTTQIYSKKYLGEVPSVLYALESKVKYDKYFLFDIDVPWVSDGLRDLGHQRKEMFQIFKDELFKRKIPFSLVRGSWAERENIVINEIDKILKQ